MTLIFAFVCPFGFAHAFLCDFSNAISVRLFSSSLILQYQKHYFKIFFQIISSISISIAHLIFGPPTSNLQTPTSNLQPAIFNLQPPTCNLQLRTFNLQPSTCNLQLATSRLKPPTCSLQAPTSNLQPPTYNLQPRTCNLEPATSNL